MRTAEAGLTGPGTVQAAGKIKVASVISGVGMAVPEKVITNHHFASYLETSDEWILERTGIRERRWTEMNVGSSELAEPAARRAIESAGLAPEDIDGIIVGTTSPDHIFPSTACYLQRRLGVTKGFAFDVAAACSGFVYALSTADAMMAAGHCRNLLVVGVDVFSPILDTNDRTTCVLFGDGAGAIVLTQPDRVDAPSLNGSAGAAKAEAMRQRGIYASQITADGSGADILYVPNGSASRPNPESLARGDHYLRMQGREVFKVAVRALAEVSESIVARAGFTMDDVDLYVTHQANERIIRAVGKQLKLPDEKVPINVDRYGNTSAGTIPIVLAEAVENGTLTPGKLVLMTAFGGGLTCGAVLARW